MAMKLSSSKIMSLTILLIMLMVNILSATIVDENHSTNNELPSSYLLSVGRFVADNPGREAAMTCDKYPTVCRAKGSEGPYCCSKQCVNVLSDVLNCGKCGKKCNYSELCCQGECVNPSVDKQHCGKCNHGCNKGSSCVYGLCNYAN